MTRIVSVITCAFVLSLTAPVGFVSSAHAKKAATVSCSAKIDGKKSKWSCAAGQKCCLDTLAKKGVCGIALLGCI